MSFTQFIMNYGCLIFFIIALIGLIACLILYYINSNDDNTKQNDIATITFIASIISGILGFIFIIISLTFEANHTTNQTSYTFDISKHNDNIYIVLNDSDRKYYISKSDIEVLDLNTEQISYQKVNYTDTDYIYKNFELKISPETAEELGIIDKVITVTKKE